MQLLAQMLAGWGEEYACSQLGVVSCESGDSVLQLGDTETELRTGLARW